jgi:hypothetical protein
MNKGLREWTIEIINAAYIQCGTQCEDASREEQELYERSNGDVVLYKLLRSHLLYKHGVWPKRGLWNELLSNDVFTGTLTDCKRLYLYYETFLAYIVTMFPNFNLLTELNQLVNDHRFSLVLQWKGYYVDNDLTTKMPNPKPYYATPIELTFMLEHSQLQQDCPRKNMEPWIRGHGMCSVARCTKCIYLAWEHFTGVHVKQNYKIALEYGVSPSICLPRVQGDLISGETWKCILFKYPSLSMRLVCRKWNSIMLSCGAFWKQEFELDNFIGTLEHYSQAVLKHKEVLYLKKQQVQDAARIKKMREKTERILERMNGIECEMEARKKRLHCE